MTRKGVGVLKRFFDLVFATFVLVVSAPVVLVAVIAVKLDSRGPAFYPCQRIGKDGRVFRMFKLRTMIVGADCLGPAITSAGDGRVTRVGRFLRRYKIDELPQFINVLRGEMSVVGPRPESPFYVDLYTLEQRRVLDVKPGVTGLAQVEFRHEESLLQTYGDAESAYLTTIMPTKLALDLAYVEHRSFLLDVQLIVQTVAVLLARDRTPVGEATPCAIEPRGKKRPSMDPTGARSE